MDDVEVEEVVRSRLRQGLGRLPIAPYSELKARASVRSQRPPGALRTGAIVLGSAVLLMLGLSTGVALNEARRVVPATAGAPASPVTTPAPFEIILGSIDGRIFRLRDMQVTEEIVVCEPGVSATVGGASAQGTVLVKCALLPGPGGNPGGASPPLAGESPTWWEVSLATGSRRALGSLNALRPTSIEVSPEGREIVAISRDACPSTSCPSVVSVMDLDSGAAEAILRAEDVREVRWTALGITVYRTGPTAGGTYLYADGWRKLSDMRLRDALADARVLYEEEGRALGQGRAVWEVSASGERVLTDAKSSDSYGIALIDPDGALAYVVDERGSISLFRNGQRVRTTPGEFCVASARAGSWFVCMPPGAEDRIAAYSIATGELRVVTLKLPSRATSKAIVVLP